MNNFAEIRYLVDFVNHLVPERTGKHTTKGPGESWKNTWDVLYEPWLHPSHPLTLSYMYNNKMMCILLSVMPGRCWDGLRDPASWTLELSSGRAGTLRAEAATAEQEDEDQAAQGTWELCRRTTGQTAGHNADDILDACLYYCIIYCAGL